MYFESMTLSTVDDSIFRLNRYVNVPVFFRVKVYGSCFMPSLSILGNADDKVIGLSSVNCKSSNPVV